MNDVKETALFEMRELPKTIKGFRVCFNVVELTAGGFKAYMLVVKLVEDLGDEKLKDIRTKPIYYVVKMDIDYKTVTLLRGMSVDYKSVFTTIYNRLMHGDYLNPIVEHFKLKKSFEEKDKYLKEAYKVEVSERF